MVCAQVLVRSTFSAFGSGIYRTACLIEGGRSVPRAARVFKSEEQNSLNFSQLRRIISFILRSIPGLEMSKTSPNNGFAKQTLQIIH